MSADDDKDSDDLNIFLNAIGEEPEEAPMRRSTNDDIFFNLDDDGGGGDYLHNPFQDFSDSNQQPVFESPKVYVAPRVMISHQDSFSEEDSRIEDARILPFSPRLRVPASPRAFVYQRSVESPRFGSPVGLIDTASPFESVKDAVSKFGGITDWKAHKIQTIERRKMVDEELEKIQEALPEYKRESELAEEAKHDALKELESTKGLIEELKLELEKAQLEEQQAKQDSELAQMRVEEMEKGVANEASVAVKAQLEVAKARQESATSELRSVREEIEMVCNEYEDMLREKELAAERAEVAVKEAKEIEREMDGLSIELIATKEVLESAHTAHLEAEEKRFGAAMGRDQDMYNWEKELKMVEDDIERLNQEIHAADDMKTRLEAASALENDLRAELVAFTENSSSNDNIHAAVDSARRELEEVKSNIEKAASEVKALKIIAGSLQSELAREREDLAETKQRESAGLVGKTDEEAREELNKLEQAMKEAEDAKLLAAVARDELRMAEELSEQAKTGMSTIENRLAEAKKEMEAARASEKLALAAIKALQETESSQRFEEMSNSPRSIIVSVEEYYELSKQAHESEEEANTKLSQIVSQIEVAKEEESRILEKLEEVNREMSLRKEELKAALGKAEKARDGKLSMEQELRKWRSENGKRRTEEPEKSPTRSSTFAFGEQGTSSNIDNNNNNVTNPETKKKKKKKLSLLPKVLMFLSRKKSHK
ncbi:Protein WEAK CHLOROPLAST MOVEMENT UNDER BLUE LIGHT-like 3 [Raphanus sativus]|uniref:Protein WEAK CHLOROPLAST MOVEMENT UNDER BLUE LIGHT-like 3 n=1 Tax=Raphanus sativus TaxID=3726 RepID=A0A6J0MZN9_RAPSA|nr:protein WEAK CHLOROPLAST MOVEMENT UNDER BLUE LIGHT-like 3 [Raphanus sativus]XP_018477203.2 protein WEAK CHLOROPLAST MOVEMENT UNDER BLUE LIGHT-like 3 [Raphanus sativus]KAJ4901823.1 Protein WEAK CHLOROPLAST MOVEMENT UNDER BLUE LIGHT-like 3 [Raphanus sativus]